MTLSKQSLRAGLATLSVGAATAVFMEASEANPQEGFSFFMRGDLFPGCAANTLLTSPQRSGDLYIGDRTVSLGDQSISREGGYTFATSAKTPEDAQALKESFKTCLREQTFNPDVRVLRVIPTAVFAPAH